MSRTPPPRSALSSFLYILCTVGAILALAVGVLSGGVQPVLVSIALGVLALLFKED